MEAVELQTFVINYCFQSLLVCEACASASLYHVANMRFERVLERGRGGSILSRKHMVSHNNMKNNIMEIKKVDAENEQGETKEAQEAHLLDLYNSALQVFPNCGISSIRSP